MKISIYEIVKNNIISTAGGRNCWKDRRESYKHMKMYDKSELFVARIFFTCLIKCLIYRQ